MSDNTPQRPRAGTAYLKAIQGDTESQAALQRAQERLGMFGEAMKLLAFADQVDLAEISEDWRAMVAEFEQDHSREWGSKYNHPCPQTLEDWQKLAYKAKIPVDRIEDGQHPEKDFWPYIEGYLELRIELDTTPDDSGLSVRDRMMAIFTRDKRCVDWTQREWAEKLNVTRGAIKGPAWKAIMTERARQKEALKKGGYSALK